MSRTIAAALLALGLLLSGARADSPLWTVLTLSESAQRQVAADRITAVLRLEEQGKDARAVQSEINRRMAQALELARAQPAVRVEGGSYSVSTSLPPPEQRAEPVWTAVQQIALEGGDAGQVLALAGALQELGFLFSDLRQHLSPERQREAREELLREASARLRATVDTLAASLGLSFTEWSRITLLGAGPEPKFARSAMAAEAFDMPVTAGAEITVSVTLEGEARLIRLP
jgi:predicted secreted protein